MTISGGRVVQSSGQMRQMIEADGTEQAQEAREADRGRLIGLIGLDLLQEPAFAVAVAVDQPKLLLQHVNSTLPRQNQPQTDKAWAKPPPHIRSTQRQHAPFDLSIVPMVLTVSTVSTFHVGARTSRS